MDPTKRLDRRTAGQWLEDPLPAVERAFERDREPPVQQRVLAGEKTKGRSAKGRSSRRIADPHPNAPQLIRLVKTPTVLYAVNPRRTPGRPAVPWADLGRERLVSASQLARAARGGSLGGNPLRVIDDRRTAREPRLSVDAWLMGRDR